jgi:hypothetical protein
MIMKFNSFSGIGLVEDETSVVVWHFMNNLAEMVTYLPMNGITVPYFVKRSVDPSLASAAGMLQNDQTKIYNTKALQAGTTGAGMKRQEMRKHRHGSAGHSSASSNPP